MSKQRDIYFEKNIRNQSTVKTYLGALAASPYRTHRRMAVALLPIMEQMLTDYQEAQKAGNA